MKMRRSPLFKLWAGLLVSFFMSGMVSPSLVWCHESNGTTNFELGGCTCANVLPSQAASEPFSLKSVDRDFDSCFDTTIFIVGPNQTLSYYPTNLITQTVGVVALHSPTDSNVPRALEVSPAPDEITPFLASIRSIVLLI